MIDILSLLLDAARNGAVNPGLQGGHLQTICTLCSKSLSSFSKRRHYYAYQEAIGYFRVCTHCYNAHQGIKTVRILRVSGSPSSSQRHKRLLSVYKSEAGRRKSKDQRRSKLRQIAAKQKQKAPKPSGRRLT